MATSANRHIQIHRRQESTISVKTFLISIAVSIVVILSLWAWKSIERKSIIQKSQRQSQFYKNKIAAKLDASLKNQLLVFSKPLVWQSALNF